ncbi:MAG: WhiB family transcriptional regulator [Saccharopolyspora rectivirgula]|jgi:WhiB family redox-sensing transcriptional regulator|uniref:Transcriptional regulator WhiB n=1 Tax=Saccharopolyspora rectivirgula TaxID=28042 RepID=A0A073AYZ5_9PSEU|nr:WhiB family transcriptional regulator [Saccharopolyspora rectivirgula]KEI45003.1 hypothetical protein GU90_07300 [Saccharopolyspora rectivirgula]
MTAINRLPKPVAETWQWQMKAACRHMSTQRFFHPENERGNARARREQRAKEICARCPVIEQCREYALQADEPYGIWGGLGERERWEIIAQRRGNRKYTTRRAS